MTELTDKLILVTGAGGLIGSAVCREIGQRGARVRALLQKDEPPDAIADLKGIEILRGDVRSLSLMHECASGCFAIIHTAALNKLWHRPTRDFHDINVTGTSNVCRAAVTAGVEKFIFTGSCSVMGRVGPGEKARETAGLSFTSLIGGYEKSKLLAETIVRGFIAKGMDAVILRPTSVMGPNDRHGTPQSRLIRAYLERAIPAYFNAGINVVDSRDVAEAHVNALTMGRRGETYIIGAHNVRLGTLFELLERETDIPAPLKKVGFKLAMAGIAVQNLKAVFTRTEPITKLSSFGTLRSPWFFDSSKAVHELGFCPRPLAETVRDAARWHINNIKSEIRISKSETNSKFKCSNNPNNPV